MTLFLDIDGTILRSDHRLSDRVAESIENLKRSGVMIVLASGRIWNSIKPIYDRLELTGPSICCNGAHITAGPDGRCIYEKTMDDQVSRSVIARLRNWGLEFLAFRHGELFYEFRAKEIDSYHKRVNIPGKIIDFDSFTELNLTKAAVLADQVQLSQFKNEIEKEFSEKHLYVTYSYLTCLEILAGGVNKGTGMMEICRIYDMKPEETAAIGDGWNDLPILKAVNQSWVMGNAPPELKAMFPPDRVLPNTDEDGAVQVMENMLT